MTEEKMENLAEIKTVSSPRRLDCTQELMDLFTGYICEHHPLKFIPIMYS
jgi:hypothetical protein